MKKQSLWEETQNAQKRPATATSQDSPSKDTSGTVKVTTARAKIPRRGKYPNISATLSADLQKLVIHGAKDRTEAWQYVRDNWEDFDHTLNVRKAISGGNTAYIFVRKDGREKGYGHKFNSK